jgi:hypothetical protein
MNKIRRVAFVIGAIALFGGMITVAIGMGIASLTVANIGFIAMVCGIVGVVFGDPI